HRAALPIWMTSKRFAQSLMWASMAPSWVAASTKAPSTLHKPSNWPTSSALMTDNAAPLAPTRWARLIPCFDIKDGRVVNGVNFQGLTDAGDPLEVVQRYQEQDATELTLLDIAATTENRAHTVELLQRISQSVDIP